MKALHLAQIAGPAAFVLVVWTAFGIWPHSTSGATERLGLAEADAQTLIEELESAKELPESIADLELQIADNAAAVPSELDMGALVSDIDELADSFGVELEQISPSVSLGGSGGSLPRGTSAVSLSLGARGSYEELMAFVDQLASLDRLVMVDLIQINSDAESGDLFLDASARVFTTADLVASDQGGAFVDDLIEADQ